MADPLIVQGAAQVAQAQHAGKLAGSKAAVGVGKFLSDGIGKIVQKRNREFNKLLEAELQAHAHLPDKEYNQLMKDLRKKRGGYVYLNKRGRIQAEKDLNTQIDEIEKKEQIKDDISKTIIDGNNPPEEIQKDIEKIITGENPPIYEDGVPKFRVEFTKAGGGGLDPDKFIVKDEKGEDSLRSWDEAWAEDKLWIMNPDGTRTDARYPDSKEHTYASQEEFVAASKAWWQEQSGAELDHSSVDAYKDSLKEGVFDENGNPMNPLLQDSQTGKEEYMTMEEIANEVDKYQMDKGSQEAIDTVIRSSIADGTAFVGGDTTKGFNKQLVRNNIQNNIIAKGDLNSLATDNVWGNSSWQDDMTAKLMDGTYADYGIDNGDFQDPTPDDGKITKTDAQIITQAIMKDEALLKETLTDYYTAYAESNYNIAAGNTGGGNNQGNNANNEDEFASDDINTGDEYRMDYDAATDANTPDPDIVHTSGGAIDTRTNTPINFGPKY